MHEDFGDLDPTHETRRSSRPWTPKRGRSATDTAQADLLIAMKQTLEDANKPELDDEVAVFLKNLGTEMCKITVGPWWSLKTKTRSVQGKKYMQCIQIDTIV